MTKKLFPILQLLCNYNNFTMFPSVIKDDNLKEKIKEKQWDERFGIKNGIPQYSPLQDKHTKSYRKIITNKKQQNDSEVKPKKLTYFQKRLELVEQLYQLHKPNKQLIEEYEELASKYKIPNFYIYYTLLPLFSPSVNITQYLFRQKKQTKEQSSHYHRISTSVKAREQCLQRLRKTLGELQEGNIQKCRSELRQQVQHLRMLTENVVNQIKRWRDHLSKIDERPVYYSDSSENYLVKILNDNKFIFSSKLSGALAFGQKNDPFLLVPVKKSEGKQSSLFTEIVKLTKDMSHYQKYMEYLATQKAYDLAINAVPKLPITYKNPVVQKIYKPLASKVGEPVLNKQGGAQQDDSYKKMQVLKAREERLKKNDERIKSIRGIYQTYGKKDQKTERNYLSQRKVPETDTEDKRGIKKRSESIKVKKMEASDVQFQSLVKAKLEVQKTEKQQKRKAIKILHSKSASKFHKNEQKMIESLRDIQSTLRNKLQVIQQEQKTQVANNSILATTQQKFVRKNNEDIIKQLKAQILGKIEKEAAEKERLKKLKRQQQQIALQQIKQKLKKEMEQKLQQKKREKMLQRQELERKLKYEEERLNNQRQLQLQLQIKLTKQKQLRELQKIKRQALQREKKFKEELEKQQFLRRQQQQAMENQKRQKQRLIEQLRKKQLKQQIQDQLRKQIKNSSIKDKSIDNTQQEVIRNQKQAELAKEIQLLKLKEGVQMLQLKKQNQLRQRMLKLKKEQEELKRKEIQHLMRSVVQQEKQQLEQDATKQRVELQERMRANVKQKLLQEYKNQKQARIQQIKHQRQAQLQQEVYREKIREKIEKQMRIEAIQRTKKDLEERQHKKYEVRSKLQAVKNKFDKDVVLDKQKIQEDVKKQMIEKVIFDKQAQKEAAKYDLRLQFQKELMASAIPQLYQNKDSFLVKNINYFQGDLHLNSKIMQLKPTNQKPSNQISKKKPQKGEIKQIKDTMTLQQLQVYQKQKQKVSQIKEQKVIIEAKLPYEEEGFEKLNIVKDKRQQQGYEVKIMKMKQASKKQQKKSQKLKSKKKKQKQSSSQIDSEDEVKKKKHSKKNKKRYYQEQASQDSQDVPKKKKKEKKRKQTSSQSSQSQKKSPTKNVKRQTQYDQVGKSQKKSKISPIKQLKKVMPKEKSQKAVVHFDSQNKIAISQIQPITIKPQKVSNTTQKYKISLEAIPEAEFDEYLQVHLSSVTPLQLAIQMNNREDLYRKLIGELTFCLLVAQHEGRVIGQALAYHDRTRSDIRKFNIIHLGTYKDQFIQDFLLSLTNYIFRKDPCDQIQFLYKFNQANSEQLSFSQSFNKWFDKYGSVFQKKVDDNNYERKYLLKRQFNQKCQVVLGGINKNTFRNLFSVYSGVLMSDTDMLQFKQQLIDTLAPENQICYSLMVSQLFRTYLSPDEAQILKNKVKEFVKLKQMLILVVSMQKKKLKLQQLKLYEYKSLIELNMRLMSQGKEIIRYCKDSASQLNRIYYAELNHAFNLPFHFQTTSLPVEANIQGQIRQISYFRLSPLPPFKLHIIKSSLYNAEMNILPTENSKYKIFVLSAQEYNQIRQANNLDLFMYIRLFLKNVKSHNVAVWKYVWLPEMTDKGAWNLREFKSFLNKDFYTHDTINISYRQFLPGALIIQPEHRDLVITPPFIVGVMSMNLEQVSEGSPLYARMIEVNALKTLEIQK